MTARFPATRRTVLRSTLAVAAGATAGVGAGAATPGRYRWTAAYGGDDREFGRVATATEDGIALAGDRWVDSDPESVWLQPVSADGTTGEAATFDRFDSPSVGGLAATGDGGIALGVTDGPIASDDVAHLLKLDASGAVEWTYEASPSDDERGYDVAGVCPAGDGGAVLVGARTDPIGGEQRPWAAAVDDGGSERWSATLAEDEGGTRLKGVAPDGDGGAVAVGVDRTGDEAAAWVRAFAGDGSVRFDRTYRSAGQRPAAAANAVLPLGDGCVIGAYATPSVGDVAPVLLRIDGEGAVEWTAAPDVSATVNGLALAGDRIAVGGSHPLKDSAIDAWLGSVTLDGRVEAVETRADGRAVVDVATVGGDPVETGTRDDDGFAGRFALDSLGERPTETETTDAGTTAGPGETGGSETTASEEAAGEGETDGPTTSEGGPGETASGGDATARSDGSVPGFGVGSAVAALGVGAWLRRRRGDE